ncbi:MAG: cell division protein ZapA [Caulobacter sp.]|nr:cell division protein ZapA [Caulobacter sp.]
MAQLNVTVNGKPFLVGCEDGQEHHLMELAATFDQQVQAVGKEVGQLGETRLFLMTALLLTDELSDLRMRLGHLQNELARSQSEQARIEMKAAAALESAARKIEKLAGGEG